MPYIEGYQRVEMDAVVETMILRRALPDGRLSYVLFKLCKDTVVPSYNNYKNFIGELNECAAEIRRRFMVPYEDEKCHDNGDVE
jgi:hypothetical protein